METFLHIREDLIDLYSEAYRQKRQRNPEADQLSIKEVRSKAVDAANAARNYDPHEKFHESSQFAVRLWNAVKGILKVVLFFSLLTGATSYVALSRNLLKIIGAYGRLLSQIILTGSGGLALIILGIMLLPYVFSMSTFITRTLNQELVVGDTRIDESEDEDEAWGFVVLNESLAGGNGFHLLTVFSILKLFSFIVPRRDPYTVLKERVESNMDVFAEHSEFEDVFYALLNRFESSDEGERDEEQGGDDEDHVQEVEPATEGPG